ncbi:MAG: hypothetical protein AAGH15_14360 [Myxococcota bacterium]
MPSLVALAWGALALLHALPALVAFVPRLAQALYGLAPQGDLRVILQHRGVLFAGLVVLAVHALAEPGARRAASLTLAVSVLGFLALYALGGFAPGPLRRVAVADLVAVPALACVVYDAWWR